MYKNHIFFVSAGLLLFSGSLFSQEIQQDSIKTKTILPVIIYGNANFNKSDYTALYRKNLDFMQANTLGETLSKIPGVQNSWYGSTSGAPVIRSLSGNRVKVMNNGVATNDMSGISPDFNYNIDINNVEGIQVYKNAATVLFGGNAVGGAVNIRNKTIPSKIPEKKVNIMLDFEGSTNNGQKQSVQVSSKIGKNIAWRLGAMHYKRDLVRIPKNTKPDLCYDPKIIGFDPILQAMCQVDVVSRNELNKTLFPYISQFVLDHLHDPDYGLSEEDLYTFNPTYYSPKDGGFMPNPKNDLFIPGQDNVKDRYKPVVKSITDYSPLKQGVIPNSFAKKNGIDVGVSYLNEKLFVGLGYQGNYSYYGVPAFAKIETPEHSHGKSTASKEAEYFPINVQNLSHSFSLESKYNLNTTVLKTIKLNYNAVFSEDHEMLGIYRANTFFGKHHGARLEAIQNKINFWSGLSGIDYSNRKLEGKGKLRYLPNNLSTNLAVFILQKIDFQNLNISLGYRNEQVSKKAFSDPYYIRSRGLAGGNLSDRKFNLHQFNSEIKFNILGKAYISAQYNHSERAPEVNELYAGNNHYALIVEENGNDELKKEQSNSVEIGGGIKLHDFWISGNWYYTNFQNYLYLAHTGITRVNNFPVKEWRQDDTLLTGWEAEAGYAFKFGKENKIEITSYFDLVKNKNQSDNSIRQFSDGDFMPNMPTSRYGFSFAGAFGKINTQVSFDRYMKQKYLGRNINDELQMPAYSLLSARISYLQKQQGFSTEYFIGGTNLLNVEARPQNSVLKYLSPLPGININFGVKIIY